MILTVSPDTRILSDRLRACAHRVHVATTGFTTTDAIEAALAELASVNAIASELQAQLSQQRRAQ